MPPDKDMDEAVTTGKITVVCQGCGARYKVKDATVRGHRFRAVCKRCGGIIVARCTDAFTVVPEQGASTGQPQSAMQLNEEELHQEEEASWYVVIDRKPHGPMTSAQVRASYADKQIFSRSYMWRAGEPEWQSLFDCPEFKDLFYDPKTTLYNQPDDQADEGGLSEEAAQFIQRQLTEETHAGGPDGRRFKENSEGRIEGSSDYDTPGGEEDYLAEDASGMPAAAEYNQDIDTAYYGSRDPQQLNGDGYVDDPRAGEPFQNQQYPDPQDVDPQYLDQQYPDQQYLDQQAPADPYAQEPQEAWAQEPEMEQPWSPPEPEPRRKAVLPAPTGIPQRDFMNSEESESGEGFTRAFSHDEPPAAQEGAQASWPGGGAFSSAPSLSALTHQAPTAAGVPGQPPSVSGAPQATAGQPLFGESDFGAPNQGGTPGLPNPAKSVFEDGLKPVGGPVLNNSNFLMAVEDEEPFWTTSKIIALAAVGGGLFVALTVVLVVSLVRPAKEVQAMRELPAQGQQAQPSPESATGQTTQPKEIPVKIKSAPPEQGTAEKRTAEKRTAKKRSKARAVRSKPQVVIKEVKVKRPVASRRVKRPAKRVKRPARRTSRETNDFDDLLGVASAKKKAQKPEADDLDDLLAVAPRPKPRSKPTSTSKQQAAPAGFPVQPSKASIRAAMRSVLPRIRSCHDKHQQTGTIRVSLTIRGNGTADVDIIGAFAGTPTGFCVLGALERRTFPRFTGKPVRLVYPYNLQ